MRVDPARHRRGHGAAIPEALEARVRDRGFERAVLDVTPDQPAAIALYESFGYEAVRRAETPAGEVLFYGKGLSE